MTLPIGATDLRRDNENLVSSARFTATIAS
jgi:hypothetical protein